METPNYTARIIEPVDLSCYVDIQPPIGAISEDFLSDFGADNNTTVEHKLTTAHTTRLSVTVNNESLSGTDRVEAITRTTKYILRALTATDRGLIVGSGRPPTHTIVLNSSEL